MTDSPRPPARDLNLAPHDGPPQPRCFLCDARSFAPTDRRLAYPGGEIRSFGFACGSCGVLVDEPGDAPGQRQALDAALAGARFALETGAPFGLDLFTLRIAAAGRGLAARPTDAAQAAGLRRPHAGLAALADLVPLADLRPLPVTLAILCRGHEAEDVAGEAAVHLAWTDDVLVLADAPLALERRQGGVRLAFHPHGGDFARQRNRAQDLGRHSHVLQIDRDETIDAAFAAEIPRLAALADEGGILSVGFPRRNLVDGVLSDLHPDTQYRLNRREIRYVGRVHERPERPWQRTMLVPRRFIDHHLGAAHVAARSVVYEAIAPGEGRLFEREALLAPYQP
ncbi:hypothetical protein [Aureimonas sp. AU12]|uniref:hypothetical protein n=1 Tax=Aureimonas sp. AU12 TaxID=1638161 RepID=UPI00078223C8|nr:hypothetical protein [Aureimonas sp. AU12]